MSREFSANISSLRREKNISQKQAADKLGISQALLSHYEKGIRECNLDFVKKAAEFYNVSTDYLLGFSESRNGSNDFFTLEDLPGDSQMKPKTLIRAMYYALHNTEINDEAAEMFFTDYFTLCLKKYMLMTGDKSKTEINLCDFSLKNLSEDIPYISWSDEEAPLIIRTLNEHSSFLINNDLYNFLK